MGAGDCCGEGRDCADDGAAPGDEMWAVLDVSADIAAAEFTRTSGAAVDVVCETVLRFAVKGSRKVGGSAHDLSMQARLICRDSIVGGVRQQQGVVVGLDCCFCSRCYYVLSLLLQGRDPSFTGLFGGAKQFEVATPPNRKAAAKLCRSTLGPSLSCSLRIFWETLGSDSFAARF